MTAETWPVGTKVAWYGPYDRQASSVAEVEKVYKTGHIVVRGRRFRLWGDGSAHETGDGYSKASVCLLTPEREVEIAKSRKAATAKQLAAWLERCDVDSLPDDALAALVAVMREDQNKGE